MQRFRSPSPLSSPRKRGPRHNFAATARLAWVPAFAGMTVVLATPARADDADATTPELVVTATRVPTPVVDIPAGVTVIDRQTIEQRGYNTLAEALAAVPGVRVSQ